MDTYEGPNECQWFARCTNPPTGLVSHPVLEFVPTCQRCADKLGLTFTYYLDPFTD